MTQGRVGRGSAPGKVIVFGEHAVVFGRPAVALPLSSLRARVQVRAGPAGDGMRVIAPAVGIDFTLSETREEHPLAVIIRRTLHELGQTQDPSLIIRVGSDIPPAAGLGSGAAVSAAIVRALADYFARSFDPERVSNLTWETEQLYHGTPSGIDNTVVAYERPVFFQKGSPPATFRLGGQLTILIAHSGARSSTREAVEGVRRSWEKDTQRFEGIFDRIGRLAIEGKSSLEKGDLPSVGRLMDENQALLHTLGVSNERLEQLCEAARGAGALGAKLSGAGCGGNIVALVQAGRLAQVREALNQNHAADVREVTIQPD